MQERTYLKKYQKSSGVTLTELLAVIIVLAIIALISTPLIMYVLAEARKNLFQTSVNELLRTMQVQDLEFDYQDEYLFTIIDGNTPDNKINMNKKSNLQGEVLLKKDTNDLYALHDNEWCIRKLEGMEYAELIPYEEGTCTIKAGNL